VRGECGLGGAGCLGGVSGGAWAGLPLPGRGCREGGRPGGRGRGGSRFGVDILGGGVLAVRPPRITAGQPIN